MVLCAQELVLVPPVGALAWPGVAGLGDRDAGPPVLRLACSLDADLPSPRNRQTLLVWGLKAAPD